MFDAFRLTGPIGGDANMDLSDTLATKQALHALGHMPLPDYGLTPYPDHAMIDGLKSFQRVHGLRVDGEMRPDGPTVKRINVALQQKAADQPRRSPAGGTQVAQVVVPGGPTPLVPGVGGAAGTGGLPPSYRYRGPDIDWAKGGALLRRAIEGKYPVLVPLLEQQGPAKGTGNKNLPSTPATPTARAQMADPLPPTPPSEPPRDEDRPPTKTTLPRPPYLGPPTEIFPNPEERWNVIESFPDQTHDLLIPLIVENSRGDEHTQADNDYIVKVMADCMDWLNLDWEHVNGAHTVEGKKMPERLMKATGKVKKGARPDITWKITDDHGDTHMADVQTVTTWKDGETPVAHERRALQRIWDLKDEYGELGSVTHFPKSRGKDREQWEKKMDHAVWDYCLATLGRFSKRSQHEIAAKRARLTAGKTGARSK